MQHRESPTRATEIMRSVEARHALDSVSSDVMSLHESFHTALTAMDDMESITGSILGEEATELDAILINTTLYQKAFKNRIRAQREADRETTGADRVGDIDPNDAFEAGPSGTTAEWQSALDILDDDFPNQTDAADQVSVHSQESDDTVRGALVTAQKSPQSDARGKEKVANPETQESRHQPAVPPPGESLQPTSGKNRLPTLFEVLSRRTTKPYSLFEFYIYMRDIQRSVDYLDFW